MQRNRSSFASLLPETRRAVIAIGLTTLGFVVFSLIILEDLLTIEDLAEAISNSVPVSISLLGVIATWLAWKNKTRTAGLMMIVGMFVGMLLIPIVSATPAISSIAAVLVVVIPTVIALYTARENELAWVIIISLVFRAAIELIEAFKPGYSITPSNIQTAAAAQWVSIFVIALFIFFVARSLGDYPFRIKMILMMGLLTIVPIAIITGLNRRNLETTLFEQANQSLVLSADQLSAAVDTFIRVNLDGLRTEAQLPAFEDYLAQPRPSSIRQGRLLERGTEYERVALDTLIALSRKDPINVISYQLIDIFGLTQLSTNEDEIGRFTINEEYFLVPFRGGLPYLSPVIISADGTEIIHFSSPVRAASGDTIGVLEASYSAAALQQILIRNSDKLGMDVSAMLLDENRTILGHSSNPDLLYRIVNPPDPGIVNMLTARGRLPRLPYDQVTMQMEGLNAGLENIATTPFFSGEFDPTEEGGPDAPTNIEQAGAAKVASVDWYVVAFIPQSTLLVPVQAQAQNVVLISILISLAAIAVALGVTQVLVAPILSLTRASELISQGEIDTIAEVRTNDEIGALARGFNAMTAQLRELIAGLEQRVAERTRALERRAVQLQAAADVGGTAARLRNLDELLRQVTRLISRRFGFYHVGIFLLDERGEYALLRAANSEGGQRMLARGHKLKVGQVGIVGNVTETGQPRIALDVDQDTEFFNNPDLPLTHSEMALPLIVGGKVLGALDVQSVEEAAFAEEDVTTLRVLADQIAIAIENARLFTESQTALDTARRAYGETSREGWQRMLGESQVEMGYISLAGGQVLPADGQASPEFERAIETGEPVLSNGKNTLHLPIKIRGQSIGAIRLDKSRENGRWSPEEITLANTLSEQLGTALEGARLYSDISQRAEREFIISDIASKIGASIQLDTILRTTVQELGRALGDSEVILQFKKDEQA